MSGRADSDLQALFQDGLQAHQAGRLADAEASYRRVLAAKPDHADTNHLLGVIAHQSGNHDLAVQLITKAIRTNPRFAAYHCNLGNALHQQGLFEEAAASQRKAIDLNPEYAMAHNNLGNVLLAQGHMDAAAASYRKALSITPDDAKTHANLGATLYAQDHMDQAEASYRRAIALNPNNPETRIHLGGILHRQDRWEEATNSYREAIALDPDLSGAHTILGMALLEQGLLEDAAASHRQEIALNPDYAEAHANLGLALKELGRLEDALASYRKAITLDPDLSGAHTNLGNALKELGRFEDAAECHQRALAIRPDFPEALNNLGAVRHEQGKLDEAVASYRKALIIKPDYAEAYSNLGDSFNHLGNLDEAVASYRKALTIKPDHPEAHVNLGLIQLLKGDYRNGWEGYSWRWRVDKPSSPKRQYDKPLWDGSPLGKKRLLVWGEQGVGDEVLFASMVPDLIERGIDVILESDARLVPLFTRSFPSISCIAKNCVNQEFDFQISLGELGRVLRPSLDSLPQPAPYLIADPDLRAELSDRYRAQGADPLVGIAWHSNNPHSGKESSLTLLELRPLLEMAGATFVDLQYGNTADERSIFTRETGVDIVHDDQVDPITDLDAFAAQVAALDIVISIESSAALIAGALGIPTLVALRTVPFWCFGLADEESPWHASLRLFRQKQRGEWGEVIQRISEKLAESFSR